MTKKDTLITQSKLEKLASEIIDIKNIVQLQNDLLNFVPDPKKLNQTQTFINYYALHKATGNLYEVNQTIMDKLDSVAVELFGDDEGGKYD